MAKIKNLKQKIKGRLQQLKGDIEISTGKPVKGNIDKLKGKTNEAIADMKNNIEKSKH